MHVRPLRSYSKIVGLAAFLPGVLIAGARLYGEEAKSDDVVVAVGHNDLGHESLSFRFKDVPSPVTDKAAKSNAAAGAKITIVAGEKDENSAGVEALNDGKLPSGTDEPASNFFFAAGTDGGRIVIDLGRAVRVKEVNTYSWHTDSRAPQVYSLYGSDGAGADFNAKPAKDVDPSKAGWKPIAKVYTQILLPGRGEPGGQYGVSVTSKSGSLGKFRYLLIAASQTEAKDGNGNTFFSEIDVIDADAAPQSAAVESAKPAVEKAKAEAKPARDPAKIQDDWKIASKELEQVLGSPEALLDPAKRAELAPKAIPTLKKVSALLTEMDADSKEFGDMNESFIGVQAWLALLGDKETIEDLATLAADSDNPASIRARATQKLAEWWQANKDPKAQAKVLAEMQEMAAATPGNGRLLSVLMTMNHVGAANPDLAFQAEGIVADTLIGGEASFLKKVHAGHALQRQTMNKPVEFAGKTVEDKDFSTTQYKGKVILIDFWATWCHPCVKEIPRVAALYSKYHDQGFEVVGVSCDGDANSINNFTKKESIPWVQMWDKKAQTAGDDSWHPVALKWGILAIPQMFLIDRNGNLRSVDAREEMEALVPKLLAEKAGEKPAG